ncbi:hypothetical protein IV203_005775 [Nitzschia inconspicua]|uniref:DUF7769 domain-containing protein n=1 Tax=Nitzschia inconspicua TaxID=303405 RepID=A0A9K3PH84_9STRA|nr:hypothetical protein IV203_005775 [Nitzschia inconspicua]
METAAAAPTLQEGSRHEVEEVGVPKRRGKPLSNSSRNAILQSLLSHSKNGALEFGAIARVAKHFEVTRQTVSNIWKRGKESVQQEGGVMVVDNRRKGRCGRKKKDYAELIAKIPAIPLSNRTCFRSTSMSTGIPIGSLHRVISKGGQGVRRLSSAVKPVLTEQNKKERIEYALKNIDFDRGLFKPMMDVVHVDEKWFYMKKVNRTYFLADGEEEPHRTCKSKRFIEKVMFLAAVARPRCDTARNCRFDGKIGIWPMTHMIQAQRSSRNRPAGTMVMKPLPNITKEVYRQFICEKVIPAINEKWPRCHRSVPIKIQQDNAKPHLIREDDPLLVAAIAATGMHISLLNQPPNSPDMNVLDLGYFNAIQSLQHRTDTTSIPALVKAVEDSFAELDYAKLNKVFLTLQKCLESIILCGGGNNYKMPHVHKDQLARQGQLPVSIEVTDELRQRIQLLEADAVPGEDVVAAQENNMI